MKVLDLDTNQSFDLGTISGDVDVQFAVFDNSDPNSPDYHYIPLIFLERFSDAALVLQIGPHKVRMPIKWHLLIGESEFGDLELLPLTSLNDRGFKAFEFNPRTSFMPTFLPVEIVDVYHEVTWFSPRLRTGQMLAVPLTDEENPPCVYFAKEISRSSEVVNYREAW